MNLLSPPGYDHLKRFCEEKTPEGIDEAPWMRSETSSLPFALVVFIF